METEKVSSNLAAKKIAALEKGELTDCSFLVGPDEADAQLIHACKFDLVVASEYFAGLLRSPLTPPGPIRIKHVDPPIFKLVVEYVHCNGQLLSKVSNLEECLKLSESADEFLLDGLGQLCTELLEEFLNMDNVWTVFGQNHFIKYISSACEKFLRYTDLDECLNHPSFLEISNEALSKFLAFDTMNVKSELVLVRACIIFMKGKEDDRALFRRYALPHLRLLTLRACDLAEVTPFLELQERMFLSLCLRNANDALLKMEEVLDTDTNLCKLKVPRRLESAEFVLSPVKRVLNLQTIQSEDFINLSTDNKFTLTLRTNCNIKITGFLFSFAFNSNSYHQNGTQNEKSEVRVGVKNPCSMDLFDEDCFSCLKPKYLSGTHDYQCETSILVPKGCYFRVEVVLKAPFQIRKMKTQTIDCPQVGSVAFGHYSLDPTSHQPISGAYGHYQNFLGHQMNRPNISNIYIPHISILNHNGKWNKCQESLHIFQSIQYEKMD